MKIAIAHCTNYDETIVEQSNVEQTCFSLQGW